MSYKPFVIDRPATATPATTATPAKSQGDNPPLANPELLPVATATPATPATKPQTVATVATVAVAGVENSNVGKALGVATSTTELKAKLQVLLTLAAQAGYPEYRVLNHWVFIPEGREAWQRNLQSMFRTFPQDLPRVLAWLEADPRLMQTGLGEEAVI